ncbi:unnamed protein product [Ectocarpus sp. 6 AP-2014]
MNTRETSTLRDAKPKKDTYITHYSSTNNITLPAVASVCETIRGERREKCKEAVDTPTPHLILPERGIPAHHRHRRPRQDTEISNGLLTNGLLTKEPCCLLPAPHVYDSSATGKDGLQCRLGAH